MRTCFIALLLAVSACQGGNIDFTTLQRDLRSTSKGTRGRLGICVSDGSNMACARGAERFSLQSVMKLLVSAAVLSAVDDGTVRLREAVTLQREDLSLNVQPIAELVWPKGRFSTTIADLVRRAIVESDSAAADFLIRRLGGLQNVQIQLGRLGITGIRLDRDERHLQTEIVGLNWKPEYVDAKILEDAIARVPIKVRDTAFRAYQRDVRDTSTPDGMARFLARLYRGQLLTASSTAFILESMADCVTFPDRLKAGITSGWKVAHKTGTSGTWNGITAATNDVGILTSPDGSKFAVAVFLADSSQTPKDRAAILAGVASSVIKTYRP